MITSKDNYTPVNREDYPLMLTVKEIQEILRIGQGAAYRLLHQRVFPVLHIGNQMRVPRDAFFDWMNEIPKEAAAPLVDQNSVLSHIQKWRF